MRYVGPVLARVLALVLALALVVGGVVVLVEAAAAAQGADRLLVSQHTIDELGRRRWNDDLVVAVLAGVGLVGALAVAAGLAPRPPLLLPSLARPPLTGAGPSAGPAPSAVAGDVVAVERYSLEQVLGRELTALDSVTRARVRAGRTRLKVRVDANRRLAPADLDTEVERLVGSQLARSGLTVQPRVAVRRRGEGRS